ncbi:MAG: GNAT family N-acetyltransferase [Spirochaetales bacterium]|nr:GNAT family N-acetyltransferase [Spirochaetales bacterium]
MKQRGGLSLRRFAPGDLPGLVVCWNEVFAGKRNACPVTEELFHRRVVEQRAFDPEGLVLAVAPGGEVAGFAHAVRPAPAPEFIYTRERCNGSGNLAVLAVLPEWQGRGVGGALLERAEGYLRRFAAIGPVIYAGDYYVALYHTLEGPRQPFWGDTEVIGITAQDRALLDLLRSRGYVPAELPGEEVAMVAALGPRDPPPRPDLEALGLAEVVVTENAPWQGRIAWYPPGEPPGYHYGRFGPYRHYALALARGEAITSHLEWYPMTEPGRVALWDFRVAEEDRGHGLGSYLLDRALLRMWEQGYRTVELHTNTHNNAQAFEMYRRRGFAVAVRWLRFQKPTS